MPIRYSIYNIVKEASNADFDNEIYYAVYSTSGATATINGVSTTLPAGIILRRSITSISATADVYVIGDKDYSVDAPDTLSKYPEPIPTPPEPDVDADVQAFLDATGINDATITTALNTFVTTLKTESLWDSMVAIYPFVTDKTSSVDIQAQFKYNLKDPQDTNAAYRLTTIGSVTYSTLGVTNFNSGNWLKNWIVSDNATDFPTGPNWIAMGWYLQTNTDTDYGVIGSNDAGTIQDPYYIRIFNSGLNYLYMYANTSNTSQPSAGANALGTHIFSRISNTQVRIINSVENVLDSITQTFVSATETIGIGYRGSQTDNILSGYFFSDSLDLAEMTTMQTAFNQLQTDLGRAVH